MDAPKPSESHQKLNRFAGHWRATEKVFPSAWSAGGSAEATFDLHMAVDGFYLLGDYLHDEPGMRLVGHIVIGFDTKSATYRMEWFDNWGGSSSTGNWEGGALVFTSKQGRTVLHPQADGFVFRVEGPNEAGGWKPMQEGHFKPRT